MISRILVASAFLLPVAGTADAATRLESTKKTASTDISFVGTGCLTQSTRTVTLPETATSVDVIEPDIGTDLFTAGNTEPIATIRSLDSNRKQVTWIASGAGTSCLPENSEARWETAIILLKVEYTVKRRVLTRSTVIKRGDAICKDAISQGKALAGERHTTAGYYEGVARILRATVRRLRALKVSSDRQKSFIAFRDAVDSGEQAVSRAAAAARRDDRRTAKSEYRESLGFDRQAHVAARAYGFRTCAKI